MYRASSACGATHVTISALFCGSSLLRSSNCVWAAECEAGQSVNTNRNDESTGENCHSYSSVVNAITLYSCIIKLPIYSAWGLLRVCAACPTPRLNQSYELCPPWEQHLRHLPYRVRNGYNTLLSLIRIIIMHCKIIIFLIKTSSRNAIRKKMCK